QDAISFNEEESSQDNQRSPPRGSEEESDEPPTRFSAQGGESESVWTTGAEGGSSTVAEEYLRKCTFTLYIQMDLMEMTLEDYIRRRNEGYLEKKKKSSALSEEDRRTAREIFFDLCDAVEFVHTRGFLHRDLKPSNVLLSPNENPGFLEGPYFVRLSDFGLSTRLVDEFGAGMYKTVGCGTVYYAAPEQLKEEPGSTSKAAKYGNRVDVYSLTLILVELMVPMERDSQRPRVLFGLRSPQVTIPKEVEESFGEDELENLFPTKRTLLYNNGKPDSLATWPLDLPKPTGAVEVDKKRTRNLMATMLDKGRWERFHKERSFQPRQYTQHQSLVSDRVTVTAATLHLLSPLPKGFKATKEADGPLQGRPQVK
ncbi:unnamed protein product, partial [Cyprideis torosa]